MIIGEDRIDARGSRTEHERRARKRDNDSAQASWDGLPSAMSTTKCPKCLYGQFDLEGLNTEYVLRYWSASKWRADAGVHGAAILRATKAHLLRRSCPRCGHFFFERPADCIGLELSDVD